jgi:hypothetical protein
MIKNVKNFDDIFFLSFKIISRQSLKRLGAKIFLFRFSVLFYSNKNFKLRLKHSLKSILT